MAYAASQPVAFPHNTHVKLGVSCIDCHTGADTRAAAGIPSVAKCMLCHAKLARDKPEVKKVIDYANKGVEIPWARVYGFSASAHVQFPHAPHARANISCATCHDAIHSKDTADILLPAIATCAACHSPRGGVVDACATCHAYHQPQAAAR